MNVYISYRHIFANELIKQAAASPLALTQELRLYEILASYYLKCSIDISLPDGRKAGGATDGSRIGGHPKGRSAYSVCCLSME